MTDEPAGAETRKERGNWRRVYGFVVLFNIVLLVLLMLFSQYYST